MERKLRTIFAALSCPELLPSPVGRSPKSNPSFLTPILTMLYPVLCWFPSRSPVKFKVVVAQARCSIPFHFSLFSRFHSLLSMADSSSDPAPSSSVDAPSRAASSGGSNSSGSGSGSQQSCLSYWRTVDLSSCRAEIDAFGVQVATYQDASTSARRKLAEQAREHKRLPAAEKTPASYRG